MQRVGIPRRIRPGDRRQLLMRPPAPARPPRAMPTGCYFLLRDRSWLAARRAPAGFPAGFAQASPTHPGDQQQHRPLPPLVPPPASPHRGLPPSRRFPSIFAPDPAPPPPPPSASKRPSAASRQQTHLPGFPPRFPPRFPAKPTAKLIEAQRVSADAETPRRLHPRRHPASARTGRTPRAAAPAAEGRTGRSQQPGHAARRLTAEPPVAATASTAAPQRRRGIPSPSARR